MRKGEATRQAILDAGIELASKVGLDGLTIGSLATATGLSKSGLFAHFRSKESLQLQVLSRARDRFIDAILRPAVTMPRGEARVRALFERWLRFGLDEAPAGCLFVAAAMEFDGKPDGPVRDLLVDYHRNWLISTATIFATGVTNGDFRVDAEPEQLANDLYGVMLMYYMSHRLLRDPAAEDRARQAFEALVAGARTTYVPTV